MENKIKIKDLLDNYKTIIWYGVKIDENGNEIKAPNGYTEMTHRKGSVEDFLKDPYVISNRQYEEETVRTEDGRIFFRFNYGFFVTDNGDLAYYPVPGDLCMTRFIEDKKIFIVSGFDGLDIYDTETGNIIKD